MRILNIRYKNINSLEGEGLLVFDHGPLAESGVFAITGPNGSGKSSILDVITLALYGETFRFDKPDAHVMTKHSSESYAAVEFKLADQVYRATWQLKRSDLVVEDAAMPSMQLVRVGDEQQVIAESAGKVRQAVTELTGMDFHKFSKSMVLPQGDFSAFLNALDSERMDILEKISGGNVYADFRRNVEANHREAQTRLQQLQNDLNLLPILSNEAIEASRLDLDDFQQQLAELKAQLADVQQQIDSRRHIDSLQQQKMALERKQQAVDSQVEAITAEIERLEAISSASQYQDENQQIRDLQVQIGQTQTDLDCLRQELSMLQRDLQAAGFDADSSVNEQTLKEQKQSIDQLKLNSSEIKLALPREQELLMLNQQQLQDKQAQLDETRGWLQQHQHQAFLLNDFPDVARLRNLRKEISELAAKQKSQASWSKNITAALKKNKASLSEIKSSIADMQDEREGDEKKLLERSQGKSIDELKEVFSEQAARVREFQELNALATIHHKVTRKGLFGLFVRRTPEELPDIDALQARVDGLRETLASEENISKVLEHAILNDAMIRKLSADRAKLIDGKPCFLCGSTAHPYVAKPPVIGDAKKALVDHRGKLHALKSSIDSANAQLLSAQKRHTQLTNKQKRLLQMRSDWVVLSNRLNVASAALNIDNLKLHKQLLAQETDELEKLRRLLKDCQQFDSNIAKLSSAISRSQESIDKLTQSIEELEAQWNGRPQDVVEVEQTFKQRQDEEKQLLAKLEIQLKQLGEKVPAKGKEDKLYDRINKKRSDYQGYEIRGQSLQQDMAASQQQIASNQNKIAELERQLLANSDNLQTAELASLHWALIEKQKLIADKELLLGQQNEQLQALKRRLQQRLQDSDFVDIEALNTALTLLAQASTVKQKQAEALQQRADLQTRAMQFKDLLEQALAANTDLADEAQLLAEQRQLNGQIDINEQEIRTLENKLSKQQTHQERSQALQAQLLIQQQTLVVAEEEMQMLADPNSFELRRKAQQVMVDKLLTKANQILEKINGRYYLRSAASEHGLALEVEDTRQKNARRLPKTLSGGESFVVSLALALALAEIANNGKSIDSLFLDEGFGNLDAEALYLVMTALESLQQHGKTVGIISHVEGVKKRIKTQIELVKKPNGLSELKMVA